MNVKGKRVRRSTETADKKLAEKIHAKVLTEITEGRWFEKMPGEHKTFREMMDKYLDEYSPQKRPKSHLRDKSLASHLKGYFGELTLSEISPKDIYAYKVMRREEEAAPKTINNELILMGHAYNLAMKEWEWIGSNPVSRVSKEKVRNQVERWLTLKEEKKLLAASPGWLQQIIVFAVNTGLRQGEILDLRWPRVDLERKTLTILEQKNGCRDVLPLNDNAVAVLKSRSKVRSLKTDHVFFGKAGEKFDARNLLRAFYAARKKVGLEDLRFHDLRHTFATRLVQAGIDIYTVQKLGRWKTIQMVMRYAHHYPESLRPGVKALDRMESDSHGGCDTIWSQSGANDEKGVVDNSTTP